GRQIFTGIADEDGPGGHIGRRWLDVRTSLLEGCGVALFPAAPELVHKLDGASALKDPCGATEMSEEEDEIMVALRAAIGEHFEHVAAVEQTVLPRGAEEKTGEPVGESLAKDQQMIFLQRIE